jgi:Na+/H+-dicarboxylate symporter/ABC-type amino acid transport substrate-binding protein
MNQEDGQRPSTSRTKKSRLSPTTKILLSLALGVGVGLFFGEPAGRLGIVGDAYVGLLQMTVLPFITLSLVANIGRFSLREGAHLMRAAAVVMVGLWVIALVCIAIVPLSYPPFDTGSFFSSSLVEAQEPPDFMGLYVPSNPFRSLSQNLVPGVVLFSILLGFALASLDRKQLVLDPMDVLMQGLMGVNKFVVRLSPIGIFAIAASAAGTITLREFGRLQGYIISHTLLVVILALWILPMIVAVLTGLSYRRVLGATKETALTAFVIGSVFAVLPMLIASIEELLMEDGWDPKESSVAPEILVPLAYPFPTLGKLSSLLFVPFAAWFVGTSLDLGQTLVFLTSGLFSSFGSMVVAIPFLLDLLRLPADMFRLFIMAGVWSARVSDLLGVMSLVAFSVLTAYVIKGRIAIHWRRLAGALVIGVLLLGGAMLGTRVYLKASFEGAYKKADILDRMHLLEPLVSAEILAEPAPNPTPLEPGESRIDRARRERILRVGFDPQRLPFCFFNHRGELVGFDIDMAHRMAADFRVGLVFVPFRNETLATQLEEDHFDIAMCGLGGTLRRASQLMFSDSYLDVTLAAVVQDHRRREFLSRESIGKIDNLELAFLEGSYFEERIRTLVPDVEFVALGSEAEFFELSGDVDALVTSAEAGAAWSLFYPGFTMVNPIHPPVKIPLVYPLGDDEGYYHSLINDWIDLKKKDGTVDALFAHWILGKADTSQQPRWSIKRDVLGWE